PKSIALPVFSSDALSSVAYATQEILLVLGSAGAAALSFTLPITIAVGCLLTLVIVSYRQTVRAYPQGGGAYIVARENLGQYPGLLAAASLLIDYVLTVSVSITAGTDAVVSANPDLASAQIPIAFLFIGFVAMMNLRGTKESGVLFAIPTYGFIFAMYAMIISGVVQCAGGCPISESANQHLEPAHALSLFLILKAFAAGTTALTGVEAISDGVPAFRYPQSKNAATTLGIMGIISISMFLGVSWLASNMQVRHGHGSEITVLGDIAQTTFGDGGIFIAIQVATAAILILAANTAFQDFPRLASILARDRFMPRQLLNRGDRLVFSNGILILSLLSGFLIYVFNADLNKLIQLYLVGVFISFTLSQLGMVKRWRRLRTPGWVRSSTINTVGAALTATVLCVVVATKFLDGAWIVLTATPIFMYGMYSIHKHYMDVKAQLSAEDRIPVDRRPGNQHMVMFVPKIDASTSRALGYALSIRPSSLSAITPDESIKDAWTELAPDVPLEVVPGTISARKLGAEMTRRRADLNNDDFLTVIIPEILGSAGMLGMVRHPGLLRLKHGLLRREGIQVMDVPLLEGEIRPELERAHQPARNLIVVLVANVHNATLQAIEYAETLRGTNVRAVSFGDDEETEELGNAWLEAAIPHPLELEAYPFRDIGSALAAYIHRPELNPDGIERVVTVVIPEFVVAKKRHQILHGQTALIAKRHLLFEPGVVVVSVPYHLTGR
ncbi:MAG: APC family permease, partial [Actinomycetota bacterium]